MLESVIAQGLHGIRDLIRSGRWRGWGNHRSAAYRISMANIGRQWSTFNVEQQGTIVESWFMRERHRIVRERGIVRSHNFGPGMYGGGMSTSDRRFPYIRDVIRARNRNAPYVPLIAQPGYDPQIHRMQETLVALGYLEARHADGTVGRSNSATLDAVLAFQRRNGLEADRDLGGTNSETRRKLAQPIATLARWQ